MCRATVGSGSTSLMISEMEAVHKIRCHITSPIHARPFKQTSTIKCDVCQQEKNTKNFQTQKNEPK